MSDLAAAEARWHEWVVQACAAVGADPTQVDVRAIHGLTKQIAHKFDRPMAPVGAFILGLALGAPDKQADAASLRRALEATIGIGPEGGEAASEPAPAEPASLQSPPELLGGHTRPATESESVVADVHDLGALVARSMEQARSEKEKGVHAGRASTLLVRGQRQRTVLMALLEGQSLSEHEPPAAAILHVLEGSVRLHTSEREWALRAGELMAIPQERHGVEAVTDAAFLLTVAL